MARNYIDVRVDFTKEGEFHPISFIDTNGKTYYIKSINRVEDQFISLKIFSKRFYCSTMENSFVIIMEDNKWFIEE